MQNIFFCSTPPNVVDKIINEGRKTKWTSYDACGQTTSLIQLIYMKEKLIGGMYQTDNYYINHGECSVLKFFFKFVLLFVASVVSQLHCQHTDKNYNVKQDMCGRMKRACLMCGSF